jgi:hypothetical protein
MNKIQKILRVGEEVFTPAGQPLKVERIGITGIFAGGTTFPTKIIGRSFI